jgi:hypothetical protein
MLVPAERATRRSPNSCYSKPSKIAGLARDSEIGEFFTKREINAPQLKRLAPLARQEISAKVTLKLHLFF